VLTGALVALNAETGKPCASFRQQGFVSMTYHMGVVRANAL